MRKNLNGTYFVENAWVKGRGFNFSSDAVFLIHRLIILETRKVMNTSARSE